MISNESHFLHFATCFLRGRPGSDDSIPPDFKRRILPRVKKPLGTIRGLCPQNLLDIGYGRGAFLFPLLEEHPQLPITIIDNDPQKIDTLVWMKDGGINNLFPTLGNVTSIPFASKSFDVVTALEVLEHLDNPLRGAAEIIRVSRKFSIISVPSKPDDNPQHVQFLNHDRVENIFKTAGAKSISFDWVNGHMVSVIKS